MNSNRYRIRLILAGISIIFAYIIEYSHWYNMYFGHFIILGLLPIIYLAYYEILRRIMKPWIGNYPYAPHWDKIGKKIKGSGYPKNRIVTVYDKVFGIVMFFIPILTFVILSIFLDK